jgi:hypothetical protein
MLLIVSQPIFDVFDELEPVAHDSSLKRRITVEDLLTMSSALDCNDNDMASPGNEEHMYTLNDWAVDLPVKADYQRDASGRGPFFSALPAPCCRGKCSNV